MGTGPATQNRRSRSRLGFQAQAGHLVRGRSRLRLRIAATWPWAATSTDHAKITIGGVQTDRPRLFNLCSVAGERCPSATMSGWVSEGYRTLGAA